MASLPDGFVYINDLDPTLLVDIRYAGLNNFVGAKISGYTDPQDGILTRIATEALIEAHKEAQSHGYNLVVYEAYRPMKAGQALQNWCKDPQDQKMKEWFYPRVDKATIVENGYLAVRSYHSRGSTVDVTLIKQDKALHAFKPQLRRLNDGFDIWFLDDGTVDMGASFDLFDTASHTANDLIPDTAQEHRALLKEIMESQGFENYSKEWWHFSFVNDPFPETYWDF